MKIERIRGIIFDYGGTIDSRGNHWSEVMREGYEACGLHVDKAIFRQSYVTVERMLAVNPLIKPEFTFRDVMGVKLARQLADLAAGGHISPDQCQKLSEPIADWCYCYARRAVAEAAPVLQMAHERYPTALVSNFYGNLHAVIADMGIAGMFDKVVESAVVGVRKPDPRIFAMGVEALGLNPEEVVVVGDSVGKDLLPALTLGCRAVWVKGAEWEPSDFSREDVPAIGSLIELPNALDM